MDKEFIEFIEWITESVFEDDWLYNQMFYREIILRKLVKLNMVLEIDDEYILIHTRSEKNG